VESLIVGITPGKRLGNAIVLAISFRPLGFADQDGHLHPFAACRDLDGRRHSAKENIAQDKI
jgi:hypothetical protein